MTYFIFFSCTYLQQKLKQKWYMSQKIALCARQKKNWTPCTIFVPIVISYLLLYSVKIVAFFVFNPPIYLGHKLHICLLFTRPLFHDDVMLVNHFRGEAKLVFLFRNHSISILWNFLLHPYPCKKKNYQFIYLFFQNNFSSILMMFWLNPLPLKDSNGYGNWPLSFSARPNYGFTKSSPLLWLSLWP